MGVQAHGVPGLVRLDQLRKDGWRAVADQQMVPFFMAAAWWLEQFVAAEHPDLGRDGPVCPFVPPAINRGLLWLTGRRADGATKDEIAGFTNAALDLYRNLSPPAADPAAVYKTIVVLFPSASGPDAARLVAEVQEELKPVVVRDGLMLGQFFRDCPEPGVRNPAFRPLTAPVPTLVIRRMTKFDLPFLTTPEFFAEFSARFGGEVPTRFADLYDSLAAKYGRTPSRTGSAGGGGTG